MDSLEHEGFKIVKKVGEGGYAQVYAVNWSKYPQQIFAAKVLSINNPEYVKSFDDELNLLNEIEHKNVIHVYHHFSTADKLILIIEYCANGSLQDQIKVNGVMSPLEFRVVALQCLEALNACHKQHIAHHDIKPSNFMINEDGRIILCDFGIAEKTIYDKTQKFKGSIAFAPPELFLKKPYDPMKADVWSLGITFYYLLTGKIPWSSINTSEMIAQIKLGVVRYPAWINGSEKVLLSYMIRLNPESRLSCEDLLNCGYFKEGWKAPKFRRSTKPILMKKKISNYLSMGTFSKGFTCKVVPTFTCKPFDYDLEENSFT